MGNSTANHDLRTGLPLIGCVHKLGHRLPWMPFHLWGKEHGPIYQVTLAGITHVWISDADIAHELLSKRGSIYSDRPHIPALLHDNRVSGEYLPLMSKNGELETMKPFIWDADVSA